MPHLLPLTSSPPSTSAACAGSRSTSDNPFQDYLTRAAPLVNHAAGPAVTAKPAAAPDRKSAAKSTTKKDNAEDPSAADAPPSPATKQNTSTDDTPADATPAAAHDTTSADEGVDEHSQALPATLTTTDHADQQTAVVVAAQVQVGVASGHGGDPSKGSGDAAVVAARSMLPAAAPQVVGAATQPKSSAAPNQPLQPVSHASSAASASSTPPAPPAPAGDAAEATPPSPTAPRSPQPTSPAHAEQAVASKTDAQSNANTQDSKPDVSPDVALDTSISARPMRPPLADRSAKSVKPQATDDVGPVPAASAKPALAAALETLSLSPPPVATESPTPTAAPIDRPVAGSSASPLPTASADTRSPAQDLSGAKAADAAQNSPAAAGDDTFDQIVLGLRGKLDARSGKAEIHLNPPNLGTLHVSVALENGSLTANFRTGSDVVRDLLSSNIDKLRSVLENQGITVDKLAVQTNGNASTPDAGGQMQSDARSPHAPDPDGRGSSGYSQNQRRNQPSRDAAFASTLSSARQPKSPIDLVA